MKSWTSQFGFMMATLGAAVGLGNLWKFPYMVGQNGGAAFLILFVIFSFLLGLPLMLAEFIIGGTGGGNSISALQQLSQRLKASPSWKYIGVVGSLNLLVIMSFYSVIAGWALIYLAYASANMFSGATALSCQEMFKTMISSPLIMLAGHTVFAALTGGVILAGVQKGIERSSKIMMPLLILMLVIIVGYNMTGPGFGPAVDFLFTPDFSKITGRVVLDAVGQAFFSLAAGAGCLCIYAAYLKESGNIANQSLFIVVANILIAILAGLAIFPIVFSYGLSPAAGTSMIFETLPLALGNIPFGYVLGVCLFTLFIFAALTSSISLIETPVAYLEEESILSRKNGVALCIGITWVLGVIYILLFGSSHDIFDGVIDISSNIILPATGVGFVVFVGHRMGNKIIFDYLNISSRPLQQTLLISLRYLSPAALIAILMWSLWS